MRQINIPFVSDPKEDGKPSVTLSILCLAVLIAVIAFGLNIAGLTKDTSIAMEFFMVSAGLYVGRRFQSKAGSSLAGSEKEGQGNG